MRAEDAGWHNPLHFVADDVAFFLAEGKAVATVTEGLELPLARALELSVRLSHRLEMQAAALQR